jgi:hypothetical protein
MSRREAILKRINSLEEERRAIYLRAGRRKINKADLRRLREIEAELDRLWLRRRMEKTQSPDYLDLLIAHSYRRAGYL